MTWWHGGKCLNAHKWGRPYQNRYHREKRHPDVDTDLVLGKPAGSRRGAMVIGMELPQLPQIPRLQVSAI